MKRVAPLIAVVLSVSAVTAFSQTKEQDIRALLHLTGSDKLALQMIDRIVPQFKQLAPEVPQEFWQKFRDSVDGESLIDLLVPVYAKHYSQDEVRQLIAFYRTALGKRVIEESPAIAVESFTAGSQWGQEMAKKLLKEIRDAGYDVSQGQLPQRGG